MATEAGAVSACKPSGFQKKIMVIFFCSPKAEVINKIGMSILVEEEGVDVVGSLGRCCVGAGLSGMCGVAEV